MAEDRIELFNRDHIGLAWGFQVNPSSCGNHGHYEEYIRLIATTDRMCGRGTTHVFVRRDDEGEKLLGYITLRATSYTKIIDGTTYGNPAMEIFELAVSKDVEGQHVGTALMKFALTQAMELKETMLGIEYITLCADEMAVPFYEKLGFGRIDSQGEIPREQWNVNCVPMFLKLPETND